MILSKFKKIAEEGTFALYEYTPSIFHPLYSDMDPLSFVRRIRLILELLHPGGYKVYYLQDNDDLVGYSVMTPGGRRLKCSTSRDIVTGPSYTRPEFRGRGYAGKLKRMAIDHACGRYDRMIAWIYKGNTSSIRAVEKSGWQHTSSLDVVGKFRRLVPRDGITEGNYYVYEYKLKK